MVDTVSAALQNVESYLTGTATDFSQLKQTLAVFWSGGEGSRAIHVETEDGERSRASQVETEGSEGLTREESTKREQLRGKRGRSEGSAASINNQEPQHHSKRRPPERLNFRKRRASSSLQEEKKIKRRPHGSHKWRKRPVTQFLPSGPRTRKMTRREATDERQAQSGRSSPCPQHSTVAVNDKQVLPRRSSPYSLRNRLRISERPAIPGRASPYITKKLRGVKETRKRNIYDPEEQI
ncbi:hypothetical protein TNCT_150731 [Trichonephila clavata]|uniref:Uncharacterized protein n=1 Tax=Trichonephila clavata TaxID=2740835 RepID=A0A8X6K726_TRICU|nr:hypothetical protein TNCT_150731 [Trichonephila clavata]